ncbi:hypothetical protein [Hymenobacter arizonensis]|nr:hypothetical protein [Hymenobacter arizonensis]
MSRIIAGAARQQGLVAGYELVEVGVEDVHHFDQEEIHRVDFAL